MQQQAHTIAQRLLNLYRQAHVINGGWAAVNKVLLSEANDPQIFEELEKLPTGKRLAAHINNLRDGKTPKDSIEDELLPYGGLLAGQSNKFSLSDTEKDELKAALMGFQPNPESLEKLKKLSFVGRFGNNWLEDVKSALSDDKELSTKWDDVVRTSKAYQMWDSAKQLVSETLTERNRARIQADMPEFETYLPMFGEQGKAFLKKLRTFVSTMSPSESSDTSESASETPKSSDSQPQ